MTRLENRILRAIKAAPGISRQQLAVSLEKWPQKALNNLNLLGYISSLKGRYYLCYREISVYKKGVDEYVRTQREAGIELFDADVVIEAIRLQNHLTPRQLRKYIPCVPGDDYYAYLYGVDESSAVLFERTNGIRFDFDQFEYILSSWMDTSAEADK
ncbi:MAG: hypothetical protein ACRYFX_27065 [Janthinobacterium lividum]